MREHPSDARAGVGDDAGGRAADVAAGRRDLARAVQFYLQLRPRQLPSRFLYDTLGSALFEAICHLPWYHITRAELGLLRRHAVTIGEPLRDGGRLVELGSGSGEKLATLLAHAAVSRVHAHLIDLSAEALRRSTQALAVLERPAVHVTTHQATYEDGLLALPNAQAPPTVVAFLGSNIGNFDPPGAIAFLRLIRAALHTGDYLLLGADLVKPERELLLAYDDPLGLTAVFNKNLLLRINTELGGEFALDGFAHRAIWNRDASRVEMQLVSRRTQHVRIAALELGLHLEEGETIWTESSYKYEPHGIRELVEPVGFAQRDQWIDERAAFALTLFRAA